MKSLSWSTFKLAANQQQSCFLFPLQKMLILTLQGQSQGLRLWENSRLLPSTISVSLHNLKCQVVCCESRLNTTSISKICCVSVTCIGCIFFLSVDMMAQNIHSLYIKCCFTLEFHTKITFAQGYFHNIKKNAVCYSGGENDWVRFSLVTAWSTVW